MKVKLEFEANSEQGIKNLKEQLDAILDAIKDYTKTDNSNINQSKDQSKLDNINNNTVAPKPKKYYCNNPQCHKEITKDVVAFCLHEDNKTRFQGKVYCRECQTTLDGGATA